MLPLRKKKADAAGQAAMHLSRYARRVTMLVRGDDLRRSMSSYLIDQIRETSNVCVRVRTELTAVHGTEHLEGVTLEDRARGVTETLPAAAVFVFIGAAPHTEWLGGVVQRDERGFILTGSDVLRDGRQPEGWPLKRDPFLLETSVPGVFAAGDVRAGSVKRVASGVGEGAIAVSFIHQHLADR